jgi:hypothetical protein
MPVHAPEATGGKLGMGPSYRDGVEVGVGVGVPGWTVGVAEATAECDGDRTLFEVDSDTTVQPARQPAASKATTPNRTLGKSARWRCWLVRSYMPVPPLRQIQPN